MAAVVRIKRRLDENPLETLVLNCKRRKVNETDNEKSEDLSAVLRFAGTAEKDENLENVLRKHRIADRTERKDQYKSHPVNIFEKMRSNMKETSRTNRYKVVNCFRKSLNAEETENKTEDYPLQSQITVLDIETETETVNSGVSDTNHENQRQSSNYVYDFYYTSSDDFGEGDIEDYVSVYPLNDPLFFGTIRDNSLNDPESDEDSEDSNAENHWRNDYPDEEDLESITEDDMLEAMKNLDVEEDLLSGDSDEASLVYSPDEEDFHDQGSCIDNDDTLRYGQKYAIFKAKYKNEPSGSLVNDYYEDIDQSETYY
ncbi:hypothetical protein ABEB36_002813 [Hypothenemus hampei]|uniref:Probable RNA polymerase II nuclear localization protein SLC7A6OS n=1 Tax=Hypothenemus hampei TaxID=57062 RepID=A0ABD1F8V8_HYPHA